MSVCVCKSCFAFFSLSNCSNYVDARLTDFRRRLALQMLGIRSLFLQKSCGRVFACVYVCISVWL